MSEHNTHACGHGHRDPPPRRPDRSIADADRRRRPSADVALPRVRSHIFPPSRACPHPPHTPSHHPTFTPTRSPSPTPVKSHRAHAPPRDPSKKTSDRTPSSPPPRTTSRTISSPSRPIARGPIARNTPRKIHDSAPSRASTAECGESSRRAPDRARSSRPSREYLCIHSRIRAHMDVRVVRVRASMDGRGVGRWGVRRGS